MFISLRCLDAATQVSGGIDIENDIFSSKIPAPHM